MQVDRPGKGTGEPCGSPHRRPNWVAMLTNVKKAAVAGGSSAFASGYQTRLAMCASECMVFPEVCGCQVSVHVSLGFLLLVFQGRHQQATPFLVSFEGCFSLSRDNQPSLTCT